MNNSTRAPFHITLCVMAIHLLFLFIFSPPMQQVEPPPKKIVVTTKTREAPPSFVRETTSEKPVTIATKEVVEPKQILKKLEQKTPKAPLKKPQVTSAKKKSPSPTKKKPLKKPSPLKKASAPLKSISPPLFAPKTLPVLVIQEGENDTFLEDLISSLEKNLILPERGSVKLTITVQANGKIANMSVLASESEKNLHYLQAVLPLLTMPTLPYEGKEKECVITFCHGFYDDEKESD